MRQTIFLTSLVAFSLLTACDRHPAEQTEGSPAAAPAVSAPENSATATTTTTAPTIVNWGPRKTVQGQAVHPMKNGDSGFWIKVSGVTLARGMVITFDGKPVKNIYIKPELGVVTMLIPTDYLSTPGMKAIVLKPSPDAPEMNVGNFEVTAQ